MFSLFDLDNRTIKRWNGLAAGCQRRLGETRIVYGNPGTILNDVRVMLEAVGPDGMATQSHNGCVPSDRLAGLNAKVGHPLEIPLKRPLLRDYPNLAGVFVLLRVMGLLVAERNRLVLSPPVMGLWTSLNPTEQYFTLLEALMFHAGSSVLGQVRTRNEFTGLECVHSFLARLNPQSLAFGGSETSYLLRPGGYIREWMSLLLQQFGLIDLRAQPQGRRAYGGRGWLAENARLTPWGVAVTWALLEFWKQRHKLNKDGNSDPDQPGPGGEPGLGFGSLKPFFQTHVPEWRRVFALSKPAFHTGTHVFKVTLGRWQGGAGGIWRRLAVPPGCDLDSLAGAILKAFKLDDDHLYDFQYRDKNGRTRNYEHPSSDDGPTTTEILIGELELPPGETMRFIFDYGDHWEFKVRLERIEDGTSRLRVPKVIESAGKPPPQYPPGEW